MFAPRSPTTSRRPAPAVALLAALLTCGCSRSESDWLDDAGAADPFVRSLAVVALGQATWDDPDAVVDRLIQAMGDTDKDVSERAADALLRQERRVLPILLSHAGRPEPDLRKHLDMLVLRLGDEAVPALRDALARRHPSAGPYLVNLLAKLGPAGQTALLEASHHDDDRVRRAALDTFVSESNRSEAAAQRLVQAIDDESPAIRQLALASVVRTACRQLEHVDPDMRERASDQLASLGALGVRQMARLIIEDKEAWSRPARRWMATREPSDVTAFLTAYHEGEVPMNARRMISLTDHIDLFGERAIPALRRELAADEPARRMAAAAAFGGLGPSADEALPELLERLDDPDEFVRLAAAYGVMLIGVTDEATLDALALRALAEDERFARALGTAAVAGLLRRAVEARGPADVDAVMQQLMSWGKPGHDWLSELTQHAVGEELEALAVEALAQLDARTDN